MRKSTLVPFIVLIALPAVASQPLETETARMLGPGILKLEGTMELQTSRDGRERAFPFVIEYGFTDRTEIAVEPVFGTKISPKGGAAASGGRSSPRSRPPRDSGARRSTTSSTWRRRVSPAARSELIAVSCQPSAVGCQLVKEPGPARGSRVSRFPFPVFRGSARIARWSRESCNRLGRFPRPFP